MMIMPANHSSPIIHYWAGRYPGKIGWLVGPSAMPKTKIREWLPFALDNDAFTAWTSGGEWNVEAWRKMLLKLWRAEQEPLWALVPDVVADKIATLIKWEQFYPEVQKLGWKMAFAVQDGMMPNDVPDNADVIFVGGTTEWKWNTVKMWASNFPRVHVGRVNSIEKLWFCEKLGVESVDGTGWFRDSEDSFKFERLKQWMTGENPVQSFQFEDALWQRR